MQRWRFILVRAARGYWADKCSSFAAAIAYYALLSLFPLAVLTAALAGVFLLANDPNMQEQVISTLLNNLPLSQDSGRQQLQQALSSVVSGSGGFGLLGLLGAAYTGSALFGAVRTALSVVFRVERPRPLVQGKLLDLGMVVALGLLLLLSLALTGMIALAQRYSRAWFGGEVATLATVLFTFAYFLAPALVSLAVFAVLYRVVPHAALSWRQVLPGALLAAIGFEALKIGFAQYVAHFGNYNAVYGTLGFVIVFLFFAYLSAQIVLFGAELTRAYVEVATGAVPAFRPAVPQQPMPLSRRIATAVKGLFVAPKPHADPQAPYTAARDGSPAGDPQAHRR